MSSNQKGDNAGEPIVVRRELRRILSQTSVNPEPLSYWGSREDDEGKPTALASVFSGRTVLKTLGDATHATFRCDSHATVAADPDTFALAVDDDGITAVHACAINGYLETLKVLVEEGGASPFAQAKGSVDGLVLARRRGHAPVLQYLSSFASEQGKARLDAIQVQVLERRARKAAVAALLERDAEGGASDEASTGSQPSVITAVLAEQRTAKQAEARTQAIAASMAAIQKGAEKEVELLPRKFWKAEYAQIDDARGVGYYPRKPLLEEE